MIFCKELNKEFESKELLFAALKTAKADIVALKKAAIKNSDAIDVCVKQDVTKGAVSAAELKVGDYIYPVINTIYVLDSHKDVHLPGIWDKSAEQQKGKVHYAIDHKLEIDKIISWPNDVEIIIQDMKWRDLDVDADGETQVLMFKAKLTDKTNEAAFRVIKSGEPLQNSVRMQYVTINLAVDSVNPDYAEEKVLFDSIVGKIINKEDAIETGYFWAVSEAKIYKEGSAVIAGSCPITPIRRTQKSSLATSTENKTAPLTSTQNDVTKLFNPNFF